MICFGSDVSGQGRLTFNRHDHPVRFMNMFAGERLGWVVYIISMFMHCVDQELSPDTKVILLYDIACQLAKFIRNRPDQYPGMLDRLSLAMNKFHGYAHEYLCHEVWGCIQLLLVGWSNGEGGERVWGEMRPLIVAGYGCLNSLW